MVLKIHHLGHSQSDRVVWLCEELNLTYDLIKYTRDPILSPPTLKALHPLGAAPVIEDIDNNDKGNNIKLAETEACFEYILNIHGGGEGKGKKFLVKPGEENYADFLYFYHLTNGTLQPAVGRVMALRMAKVSEEEATLQRFLAKVHQVLGVLEERLGEVPYLAGKEFTGEPSPPSLSHFLSLFVRVSKLMRHVFFFRQRLI